LRPHIWPGLALAGGVVIAAVIALILIGGGGPTDGRLPNGANPGDTRLFPSDGAVAGRADAGGSAGGDKHPGRGRPGAGGGSGSAPGGSAAEFEYDVHGNRGVVLSGP
jgi:hypothetical protein